MNFGGFWCGADNPGAKTPGPVPVTPGSVPAVWSRKFTICPFSPEWGRQRGMALFFLRPWVAAPGKVKIFKFLGLEFQFQVGVLGWKKVDIEV